MSVENNYIGLNPLLYKAAKNGEYGQQHSFDKGNITDAMFVFLDGKPSEDSAVFLDKNYRGRPLVCLSEEWENHIREHYPQVKEYKRCMMKPICHFKLDKVKTLPEGFEARSFDKEAFELHPFSHGKNYPSFESFSQSGAGAVAWHENKIVASASSFFTYNNEVELDVSTDESCRGKGLASACTALMLQDCEKRGIVVHWDAQNEPSRGLAEKFGFEVECYYNVYVITE